MAAVKKKSPVKKKATPKKKVDSWVKVDPKSSAKDLVDMASGKKPIKKKAAPKKKAPGKSTGKAVTKNTRHKRNKNNLTPEEQKFADEVLLNKDGKTATDIVLGILPKISRASARQKAYNWNKDERIKAYWAGMQQRVEDQVEYGLVEWRRDVLELIEIGMGRRGRPKALPVELPADGAKGKKGVNQGDISELEVKYIDVREFEGSTAKAALELIAKQMKLLTDKTELDMSEQLREVFSKVAPTTGPPSLRGKGSNDDRGSD